MVSLTPCNDKSSSPYPGLCKHTVTISTKPTKCLLSVLWGGSQMTAKSWATDHSRVWLWRMLEKLTIKYSFTEPSSAWRSGILAPVTLVTCYFWILIHHTFRDGGKYRAKCARGRQRRLCRVTFRYRMLINDHRTVSKAGLECFWQDRFSFTMLDIPYKKKIKNKEK